MSDKVIVAAEAAGLSPDEFATRVRALLCARKCRDTAREAKIFTPRVLKALSDYNKVSRHS